MPMNNIGQGGYVPPGFGAGYPSPPQQNNPNQGSNFGFKPANAPEGYVPINQNDNPQAFGGAAPPYIGQQPPPQGYGQQPPYGGPQPPYGGPQPGFGGQQPPYGGQQPPYGGPPQAAYGGHQPGYGGYGPQPIVNQPTGPMPPPGAPGPGDWMTMPVGVPNCPRGLEYLMTIDQLLVKQKVELLEAFTGFETNNKFSIKNSLGQKVYFAAEDNDCCTRNCCGPARPFDMRIFDNYKNEVIHLNRPLACDKCCFPCCLQSLEVSAPPGNVIGSVEQEWSICSPSFKINNERGETMLRIEGPFCTFSMCGDVEFNVVSLTGENVGKISKQWSGFAREIFTDADFFGINFPMDLDVRMKAVLLGATFLIDAMFFEKSGNQESDRPGMF